MKVQLTLISREILLLLAGVLVAIYAFTMSFENRNEKQKLVPKVIIGRSLNNR